MGQVIRSIAITALFFVPAAQRLALGLMAANYADIIGGALRKKPNATYNVNRLQLTFDPDAKRKVALNDTPPTTDWL